MPMGNPECVLQVTHLGSSSLEHIKWCALSQSYLIWQEHIALLLFIAILLLPHYRVTVLSNIK